MGITRTILDYLTVNGTAHTVMWFHIQIGKHIGDKDTCFGDVPNGSAMFK